MSVTHERSGRHKGRTRREVAIGGAAFPLTRTSEDNPDAHLAFERVVREDGTPYVFLAVTDGNVVRLETAFEDDRTVREALQVEAWGSHHLYRIELAPGPADLLETCLDHDVEPASIESRETGFVAVVPDDKLEALEALAEDHPLEVGPTEDEATATAKTTKRATDV